jgi:hypothetical protein
MTKTITRTGLPLVSAFVLLLAGASAVLAGPPKHRFRATDGNYTGTLSVGLKKVVNLKVSRNGTKADARLVCDGQPYGHAVMSITGRAFSGRHQLSPGVQVWTLSGHFVSKSTATAYLGGGGVCDGRSGTVKLAIT